MGTISFPASACAVLLQRAVTLEPGAMNDALILSRLGLPKVNLYFFQRKNVVVELPFKMPNMPMPAFGIGRPRDLVLDHISESHKQRYGEDAREKVCWPSASVRCDVQLFKNYLKKICEASPRVDTKLIHSNL